MLVVNRGPLAGSLAYSVYNSMVFFWSKSRSSDQTLNDKLGGLNPDALQYCHKYFSLVPSVPNGPVLWAIERDLVLFSSGLIKYASTGNVLELE